jgi:osmotically inducible protein OsmC
MFVRKATAEWKGNLRDGKGEMASESGALKTSYETPSRFDNAGGVNPEELIAAAHASCFSMQFSANLSNAGFVPTSVKTEASVHLTKGEGGYSITRIDLHTDAQVPGVSQEVFDVQAKAAKEGCPISKALSAVPIHLVAHLV